MIFKFLADQPFCLHCHNYAMLFVVAYLKDHKIW